MSRNDTSLEGHEKRQLHRKRFTLAIRAATALGLPLDHQPATNFSKVLSSMPESEQGILDSLCGTADPLLAPLLRRYEELSWQERKGCSIDLLIAATKCEDPHAVMGAITTELSRRGANITTMMVALNGPALTQAAIDMALGEGPRAHSSQKMLLSALGTLPVPKSSVTNINARIDARQQHNTLNLQAPRLEDIVRTVAEIPAAVPPTE